LKTLAISNAIALLNNPEDLNPQCQCCGYFRFGKSRNLWVGVL